MAAAAARSLAGMEVPVVGCEKIKWIELSVPSTLLPYTPQSEPLAPTISRDVASCHIIAGNSPSHIFWRIHQSLPNVLEVVDVSASKELPESGLRLVFRDELSPFAFFCASETQSAAGEICLLYALTVSGVSYLLNLRRPFPYISGSNFPINDIIEVSVQAPEQNDRITFVTAMSGCLLTGHLDGSIGCYQLGKLDPKAPGFMAVLRDDLGIGRLWNLVSRGRAVGSVQAMVICELLQRKLLFVLHSDGSLRVWDLLSCARVFSYNISSHAVTGAAPSRLCVGEANCETSCIYLAILHGCGPELDMETITVYNFGFSISDKLVLSPDPSVHSVPLDQGRLIDMKISSSKLWMLKEDDSMLYDLSVFDCKTKYSCTYGLQEEFVADQLFQGSEHALDDVIWTNDSLLSLMKDQTAYFISSIFLRRLLQPGVYQSDTLRATVLDHKKFLSDYEFQSLTISGLKKEILTTIESEGAATNSSSVVYYWKNFCNRFFRYWCQRNTPYGLLVDSSNQVIGLIRKRSFSLFRSLEASEQLIYGTSVESHNVKSSGSILQDIEVDGEVLFDVLRCLSHINHQLGRAAAAVFYESLMTPAISSSDVIVQLLKILETGCSLSLSTCLVAQVGVDAAREKKQAAHKSHRKFSVDMFLALNSLHDRASTWDGVLNVLEKYLIYLSPHKAIESFHSEGLCSVNSFLLVQATTQVARVMFESTFEVLLLLGYLVDISGQVDMDHADVARIKVELIPRIQEILTHWLVLHFLGTTPTIPPTIEDFSSRLSSLHIGNKSERRHLNENLGSSDFTLACLLELPRTNEGQDFICLTSFPKPSELIVSVRKFCSFILRGGSGNAISFSPTIEIVSLLLRHGQYEAAENLFLILDTYSSSKKVSFGAQTFGTDWWACLHLLGFCLLVRAHSELHGVLKEQKVCEAVRCFFRAASGHGALKSLQNLTFQTGFQYSGESESLPVWRLHYYQWAMQIFEQYGMSEGARQFALAALEQVDDVIGPESGDGDENLPEPASTIRGRLWANVFKFSLDLKHYRDAYCAIISNPDEDSKCICLRRFVIVLCELGETKILCDGELPFVGLTEKVEQELIWKAERSEIFAKPNLYKLLYAFEAYHNNWRKAASYMYRYTVRLRKEATLDQKEQLSFALLERLHGLSTVINALQQVDQAYAWMDSQYGGSFCTNQSSPCKRARNSLTLSSVNVGLDSECPHYNVDVEMLEKEYVLTSAQYLLVNCKSKFSGKQTSENLVAILIQENFYDMAFTVILKFWKGSALKRELEQAFVSISEQCCSNRTDPSLVRSNSRVRTLLLLSSKDEVHTDAKINSTSVAHVNGNAQWETLELYLDKYKKLHPRLPVTVAETLLYTDPQIELPLWLVHMFKGGRWATCWGMTGNEADAGSLFRLYVDYGRYAEATNLLLEYLQSIASMRPADIINRKRMSAIWFPYTTIERLWCKLEELQSSGQMVSQCDKLKRLLHGALLNHLKQVKVDSAEASALSQETQNNNGSV